jgi:hypothetical protein
MGAKALEGTVVFVGRSRLRGSLAAVVLGGPPLEGINRVAGLRASARALLVHPSQKSADGKPAPVLAAAEVGRGRTLRPECSGPAPVSGGCPGRMGSLPRKTLLCFAGT